MTQNDFSQNWELGVLCATTTRKTDLPDKISSLFFSIKPSKLHELFSQTLRADYMTKVRQILLKSIIKNVNQSQETLINVIHMNSRIYFKI